MNKKIPWREIAANAATVCCANVETLPDKLLEVSAIITSKCGSKPNEIICASADKPRLESLGIAITRTYSPTEAKEWQQEEVSSILVGFIESDETILPLNNKRFGQIHFA